MPVPKQAPEAAALRRALRRALRAAARAWADSGSGSPWRVPRLSLSSAELLPCAPAVALLALGASMLPSHHPQPSLVESRNGCIAILGLQLRLQRGCIPHGGCGYAHHLPLARVVAGAPGCVDLAVCAVREVLFSCLVAAAAGSTAQVHAEAGVGGA